MTKEEQVVERIYPELSEDNELRKYLHGDILRVIRVLGLEVKRGRVVGSKLISP